MTDTRTKRTGTRKTLGQFLEELSSAKPTPGGGAVAALAGSLAAALVAMVASLTTGKRGAGVESTMRKVRAEAQELRDRLAELIDQDVAAFNRVMAAYKLPQDDPAARRQEIEEALQGACEIPREVAERCLRVLELSKIVAEDGNKNAVSDAGATAALAAAGLEVALLNIEINLQSIRDEAFKEEHQQRQEELAAAGARLREEALGLARGRLGG